MTSRPGRLRGATSGPPLLADPRHTHQSGDRHTGDADRTVPIAGVRRAVAQLCADKQPVVFRSYPGLDHDPTMDRSIGFQLEWIAQRFAGEPVISTCA